MKENWKSIKKHGLPKNNGWYLVTDKNRNVFSMDFDPDSDFDAGETQGSWKKYYLAWQAMPEPYNGE